jgi:serine/threonine-protein kinase HipA
LIAAPFSLLNLIIFNVLACNTDAHAKNYSIMLRGNGASLAPIYDVMCGEVWENVTKIMVKIGGTALADQLTGRHWQRLARECGLNPGEVLDRVAALAKSVIAEAEMAESEVAAMPAGGHAILLSNKTGDRTTGSSTSREPARERRRCHG